MCGLLLLLLPLLALARAAQHALGDARAFGRQQGVHVALLDAAAAVLPSRVPACHPPFLPIGDRVANSCSFNHEVGMSYFPSQAATGTAWRADAQRLVREIRALQFPSTCNAEARNWSMVRVPLYGMGYSVLNLLFKAAGLWRAGIGVFVPPADPFPWAEKDATLGCQTLFGCYFKPFQGCTPAQLDRKATTAVLWKWASHEKIGVDDACGDIGQQGVLNLTSGECGGALVSRGYVKPRKIPDTVYAHVLHIQNFSVPGWFEQRWSGLVYESVLIDQVWRHPLAYRVALDKYAESLALRAPCIAMHVRHGDACGTKWRKCSELDVYMRHAEVLRSKYGLSTIYLMTDDPKIASRESLARYRKTFRIVTQPLDRSMFEGKGKKTWVEKKLDSLGSSLLHSVLKDVHAARQCDALIGGFGGQLSKIVLGLITARKGAVPPYVTVDDPYCRKFNYLESSPCKKSGRSALTHLQRLIERDKL